MESIEDQVTNIHIRNYESAAFVPISELEQLFAEDVVRATVKQSPSIQPWKQEEVVGIVMSGAKRLFAILVILGKPHLFMKFMESDQFHERDLDAKLPFQEDTLQMLLGRTAGKSFWDAQWAFIAPVFRYDLSHRKLANSVVLPFMQTASLGEGAFGVVSKITLHAQNQGIQEAKKESLAVKLVRKCIQLQEETHEEYGQEGDILNTLRLVHHPNIIRLVTTFEYRNTYNLLFEVAEYNLQDLLDKDVRPPLWRDDTSFFIALQGLSSALATVHEFFFSELDVKGIGCHHDLKTQNVLVKNGTFLLADFGLSKLKPAGGDSKTTFRAMSYYNAPECLDFDAGREASKVGRKSDVWALGAIMLDVVTYVCLGRQGLEHFVVTRKHQLGVTTFYLFHRGGHEHTDVLSHIENLEHEALPSWDLIFKLIGSTLQINQDNRPTAGSLMASLAFATLKIQSLSVLSRLQQYAASTRQVHDVIFEFDLATLRLWTTLVGFQDATWELTSLLIATSEEADFAKLSSCLVELDLTLGGLENSDLRPLNVSARQLTRHIDRLVQALSHSNRAKLHNNLEMEFLEKVKGDNWSALSRSQLSDNISLLAAAKIAQEGHAQVVESISVKELRQDRIKDPQAFGPHSILAIVVDPIPTPVLIDWIQYDRKWIGNVGTELMSRVKALVSVLQTETKPDGFSVLSSLGFYHAEEHHSFGLVFALPKHATQLRTLKQLFDELTPRTTPSHPSLGHVFDLSHALANSILQFHKVSWLHKGISSLNICFACSSNSAKLADVTKPYLIGFNHSRPDNPDAFTHGPNPNPEQKDYSHPEYLRDEARFQHIYDYYSLGLVLLELGLWRPLSTLALTMQDEEDQSPEALRNFALKRYVPRLSRSMGSIYRDVVVRCLTSDFEGAKTADAGGSHISILMAFEEHVVAPLSRCKA